MGSPLVQNLRIRHLLASNLRHYIQINNWSESELARRSGLNQKQVNNIVRERTGCGVEYLAEIAKALRVPTYQLLIPGRDHSDAEEAKLDQVIVAYLLGSPELRERFEKLL